MEYIDFPTSDSSSIAIKDEYYQHPEEIPLHAHCHYEFTLVNRGTILHRFRGVEVPLIPGDVFLIPPHEEHGYAHDANSSITNCYFFPERVDQLSNYIKTENFQNTEIPLGLEDVKQQWDNLLVTLPQRGEDHLSNSFTVTDNLSKQGVLHLAPAEAMDVDALLHRIHNEHVNRKYDSEYMKASILQMILVIFKRAKNNQPQKIPRQPNSKKRLIINAMTFLENNFHQSISIKDMAAEASLSESYFRNTFKEVTGLSPLEYLNRLRIIKALEYIQGGGITISEAAAKVGIADPHYFTRVFKKVMGYPPSQLLKKSKETKS